MNLLNKNKVNTKRMIFAIKIVACYLFQLISLDISIFFGNFLHWDFLSIIYRLFYVIEYQ